MISSTWKMRHIMKKKSAIGFSLLTILSLSFVSGLIIKNNALSVSASVGNYTTNASTYYNSVTATSGQQLAAQLHDLITSTHRTYTSYDDNGKNKYQQHTDQYYENGSKVSGYIYEFYSGVKWPNAWDANAGSTTGGYNREHCWCQSLSGGLWGDTGGGADMHHLRPVEVTLNSTRGNNKYGTVSGRDSYAKYAKYGSNSTYALGGYLNGGVFEPIDSKKGDVARIILYTYIHYNSYRVTSLFGSYGTTNGSGSSGYFATSLLSLTNVISQSTESKALALLLQWNTNDPVDDIERRRNEQVAVYQGNRNPFIDNSSYADAIWGDAGITYISKSSASLTTGETTTINAVSSNSGAITWQTSNSSVCSLSSTSSASGSNITLTAVGVGTATITAKITISGVQYSKTCSVTVSAPKTLSSISVGNDKKTTYKVGDSFIRPTITATYSDSSTKDVTNNATFTGYDLTTTGDQTVTVSYTEGNNTKTATYDITVAEATVKYYQKCTSLSDISNGGKYVIIGYVASNTTYYAMPAYSSGNNIKGVPVTLTTSNTILTEENMSTAAVYTLTSTGNTNQYYIGDGTSYLYAAGSNSNNYLKSKASTDASAGAFTITYSTFFSVVAASSNRNTMRFNDTNKNQQKELEPLFSCYASNDVQTEVMFFKEHETESGGDPTLVSITLDTTSVQKTFYVGDTFNYDGLIAEAHYSDDSDEALDSFEVSSPDMSTSGQKTITVSYGGESATYTITVNAVPTSISASVDKTYYVGDVITSSDITVEDNLGNELDGFSFANNNYQFTYADAASGGALTNKTFTNSITYSTFTCSLTVQVQRKAHESIEPVSDTLTRSLVGVTGTSYTDWNSVSDNSDAVYAGNSAGQATVDQVTVYSLQLRSNNSTSGIVSTESGGRLKSVSVTFHTSTTTGRTLNVYGKNTAYESPSELYNAETSGTKIGTIVYGTSTSLDITGDYTYIGLRSNSGAIFFLDITITYGIDDSAENLANFIMYSDTNNQCETKTDDAVDYFEGLTSDERSTFMTSDDYVIATARERLIAWLRHEGKNITTSEDDYVISKTRRISILSDKINNSGSLLAIIIGPVVAISVGGYFFLRRKKED